MKQLRYTRQALSDVESLYEFIAQDDPAAAQQVLNRIETMVEHLPQHPEIGRAGRVADTRELIVPDTPFIVAYQIQPDFIDILAIVHTSRKWPDRL